jgi:hypothetical protein
MQIASALNLILKHKFLVSYLLALPTKACLD